MREGIYVKRDLPCDVVVRVIGLPDSDLYTGFELFWEDGRINTRLFTSCTMASILRRSVAFRRSCPMGSRGDEVIQVYDITDRFKVVTKTIEKIPQDTKWQER